VNKKGYGLFNVNNSSVKAHRYSYTQQVGPIAPGLMMDHLCRTRDCVHPLHLEPVTAKQNVERGLKRARECCRYGHPLTEDNVRLKRGKGKVWRDCRECRRFWSRNARQWRAVRKAFADLGFPRLTP
jgi:hypothetical protein